MSMNTDILESFANQRYIDGSVYKEYYPIDMRESMMSYTLNDSKLCSSKKNEISKIINNPNIGLYDKFCQFIDKLNKEDLYYIGW